MSEKYCRKCSTLKPVEAFSISRAAKDGLQGYCKECSKTYSKQWVKGENKPVLENISLHRRQVGRYKIKSSDYFEVFQEQSGRCAICHAEFDTTGPNKPRIDHDHLTNQVRGLLCHNCNVGIGFLQDNPEILLRAAKYLEYYRSLLRLREQYLSD